MQFTKLFNSILDSTIWQEPPATKLVWITLLAMSDRNGDVHASIPGLAKRAGVTLEECESALQCLSSPDKYSRTKDHEGRRIRAMDGGFTLLNHGKYRALLSAEERKEYNRKKQAEYRASKSLSKNVNDSQSLSAKCTHTEAEAEAEAEAKETSIPATPPPAIPPAAPPGDIVEKAPDSRHSAFIKAYSEAYEIETGSKYIFQPREAKTLQTFLARCPATVEQMLTMLRWAWNRSKEPFASKHHSAATIQDFLTDWQKLVMDRSQQRAGKDGQPKKPKHSSCL